MKLSIVIPVLDSHEIVKRQARYLSRYSNTKMEIIFIDDGSSPPLDNNLLEKCGIRLLRTNDFSSWSEHMATNIGVQDAVGEYIFKTDIDHIITREALAEALNIEDDILLRFRRKPAKLNILSEILDIGKEIKPHSNTHVLKKSTFEQLGGYNEYGRGYGCGGFLPLLY